MTVRPHAYGSLVIADSCAMVCFELHWLFMHVFDLTMQIWDTAGQERFRSITPTYFRDAVGLVLIYDITKGETFRNVRAWISDIKTHADGVIIMLLGNKAWTNDK
jgi:small GTP-binding protein